MKKDPIIYLRHMHDAIQRIEEYTKNISLEKFLKNNLVQAGVIREIEIIGEATKQLPIEFTKKHPDIPWKNIAGMRDKLIHDYFGVDIDAVWETIQKDIPGLKKKLQSLLKKEPWN